MKRLTQHLLRGAPVHAYAADYSALDRIAHLIWTRFGVRYHPSRVWRLLQHLKWSCQKPQRRATQRDGAAIAYWRRYHSPQIEKWRRLGASLVSVDKSGLSLVSPLKRTWAPRGHTPMVRTSLQHHERLNAIGALLISPAGRKIKLRRQIYRRSLTGKEVIVFLTHLLRSLGGPVVLVWDHAPIHRRQAVQAFLTQHPRLHVYDFPI